MRTYQSQLTNTCKHFSRSVHSMQTLQNIGESIVQARTTVYAALFNIMRFSNLQVKILVTFFKNGKCKSKIFICVFLLRVHFIHMFVDICDFCFCFICHDYYINFVDKDKRCPSSRTGTRQTFIF